MATSVGLDENPTRKFARLHQTSVGWRSKL